MLLRIRDETRVLYAQPVAFATHTLRNTPRTFDGQFVRAWRVDVDHDCRLDRITDPFGNIVQTFSLDGPLASVLVSATGEVDVDDTNGVVQRRPERFPLGIYLRETALTRTSPELIAFVRDAVAGVENPLDRGHALMDAFHGHLCGKAAIAEASTAAADAFAAGACGAEGATHALVAAARFLGIPSRVVNGYLWHEDEARSGRHVWAEAHVDHLGWVGFDLVHNQCPTDAYIRVAVGLDSLAAGPLRAAGRDFGAPSLESRVKVERVDS